MNSESPNKPKPASRTPILLSAFICPGAGQFVQKRWLAGTVFVVGFLWGFCWLLLIAGRIIISFYRMAIEFDTYEPDAPNAAAILPPFAVALLFYLIGLIDTFVAQQRIAKGQREKTFVADQSSIVAPSGEADHPPQHK